MTLVDTDILIDAARGIQAAIDYLADLAANETPAISAITEMELIVGCRDKAELASWISFSGSSKLFLSTPQLAINQPSYCATTV